MILGFEVVIDSLEPPVLGQFWSTLLDCSAAADGAGTSLKLSHRARLKFVPSSNPKRGKNRVHLDLATHSLQHQNTLVQRACLLGASPVDIDQGATPWVVLGDPEGNEFCILEPRDEYLDVGPVAAVVVDALDPRSLAAFWSRATGQPVSREHPQYASVRQEAGPWLEFVRVTEPKSEKNRVRIALHSEDLDLPTRVAQLQALGVSRATDEGADITHVTLADPEGNEFSIMTPRDP